MTTCMIPGAWEVVRITRVDSCGRPVYGDCNAVVSRCIATITDTPEVEEAEPRTQTGFDGTACATEVGCDKVNYHTIEATWSQINLDAFSFMNPAARITRDASGEAIGRFGTQRIDCSAGYAIEVWARSMGESDACSGQSEAEGQWYYRVYPWITGATPGDLTMGGTDEVAFVFTGRTKTRTRWGRGPYNITLTDGMPSGLPEPFDPEEEEPYWEGIVTLPPPEADCDCIEVPRPIPDPATLSIIADPADFTRMTVRLAADNNGLGPVLVDWGDGSPVQEVGDLAAVSHKYAETTYGAPVTIRVCDKEDPVVCSEKEITLPLPSDAPDMAITGAATPEEPNRIAATVVLPPQAAGHVVIDWGDRETTEADAGETGVVDATHVYRYPGRYRVCSYRAEATRERTCTVADVPMDPYSG
ncbi:hypothetical protein ACFC34_00545 [Streptomyces sp. NPDC056053]|uniref:hypothetical protein n=1 Tax=Streptomyces sp. NPDC056053 TaxID=3345696 RepID=UPI0035E1456F